MPFGDFATREDIYGIITRTLTRHYGNNVRVTKKREKTNPKDTMYCFPRIGVIIPQKPCKSIFKQIKREYRITHSLFRRMIMDVYIACIFSAPNLFCEKKLEFPSGIVHNDMFIEPGNKKIKIINYNTKTINNIIKEGFKSNWIEKEIEFRTENKKDYIIPLIRTVEGYDESLHIGYSFPRLKDSEKQQLQSSVDSMLLDYSTIEGDVTGKEYLGSLIKKIVSSIQSLKSIQVLDLIDLLNKICASIENESITLCLSHGDLQQGNIFFDIEQKKIYLIDWETWNKRSTWYDKFLYYYGFRNSTKLAINIHNYLNEGGTKVVGEAIDRRVQIIALLTFIIEDIKWQIDEMEVLPSGSISNGLNEYLKKDNVEYIKALLNEVSE